MPRPNLRNAPPEKDVVDTQTYTYTHVCVYASESVWCVCAPTPCSLSFAMLWRLLGRPALVAEATAERLMLRAERARSGQGNKRERAIYIYIYIWTYTYIYIYIYIYGSFAFVRVKRAGAKTPLQLDVSEASAGPLVARGYSGQENKRETAICNMDWICSMDMYVALSHL
jgi:hypothetical protein